MEDCLEAPGGVDKNPSRASCGNLFVKLMDGYFFRAQALGKSGSLLTIPCYDVSICHFELTLFPYTVLLI